MMFKPIQHWFSNISLARKISLLLSLVFVGSVLLGGTALATVLQHNAQSTISGRAVQLMGTMDALRRYTNEQVSPLLAERLDETFIPAALPTFAAREAFEMLMKENPNFKGYGYKDAVLNPTNPRDQADAFEASLVEKWKSMPSTEKEITGYHQGPQGASFFISRPIRIQQESCLVCHSTPDRAPQSMVKLYGEKNGFNWPLNEVIGVQIVEVPVSKVERKARQSFLVVMGIFVVLFTTSIFALRNWLRQHVIRPIKQISHAAEAVSVGNLDVELVQQSNDEIGLLTASFNRMKTSVSLAIKRLEKYQNRQNSELD